MLLTYSCLLRNISGDKDLNIDAECITFRQEMRELAIKSSAARDSMDWKVSAVC